MSEIQKIRIPVSRLSFPKITELQYGDDDVNKENGKYSFNLIVPHDHKNEELKPLRTACQAAAEAKFPNGRAKALHAKGSLKMPFKSGELMIDEKSGERYNGYEGDCTSVSVNFYNPMPFLDQYGNRFKSNGRMMKKSGDSWDEIPDGAKAEDIFYAGCYVDVYVTVHAYDQKGGTGVNLRCHGLMKRDEGEQFGGGGFGDPDDLFGDVETQVPGVTGGTDEEDWS